MRSQGITKVFIICQFVPIIGTNWQIIKTLVMRPASPKALDLVWEQMQTHSANVAATKQDFKSIALITGPKCGEENDMFRK